MPDRGLDRTPQHAGRADADPLVAPPVPVTSRPSSAEPDQSASSSIPTERGPLSDRGVRGVTAITSRCPIRSGEAAGCLIRTFRPKASVAWTPYSLNAEAGCAVGVIDAPGEPPAVATGSMDLAGTSGCRIRGRRLIGCPSVPLDPRARHHSSTHPAGGDRAECQSEFPLAPWADYRAARGVSPYRQHCRAGFGHARRC